MSRKASLRGLFGGGGPAAEPPAPPADAEKFSAENTASAPATAPKFSAENRKPPDWSRPTSGAVRGMRASLRGLADRAEAAGRIEDGSVVVEIDPNLLDSSIVSDRVADPGDPSIAELVESFRENGQQIPILIRPHPEVEGRYQIAYGHRRARAATILEQPVRAIVRALSDEELVIAQGKENLERRDLSFIERAFFALRLETMGFPRQVIGSALGEHKQNLSQLISVARTVPEPVLRAIGPAPKAGRPRWLQLAERIRDVSPSKLDQVLATEGLAEKPSDDRFVVMLAALAPAPASAPKVKPQIWKDAEGRKVARIERSDDRLSLSIDRKLEPEFGEYLIERLPEILAAFKAGKE